MIYAVKKIQRTLTSLIIKKYNVNNKILFRSWYFRIDLFSEG